MSKRSKNNGPSLGVDASQQKLFEDRWSGYDEQGGILRFSDKLSVRDLRRFDLFKEYDDAFLSSISHDIAVATWDKNAVLFEEGSYLDLAFFIVSGQVDVYLEKDKKSASQPIFNNTFLSVTSLSSPKDQPPSPSPGTSHDSTGRITYLTGMDFNLPEGDTVQLGPGEIFGEIGTLNGWPQSVTARTAQATELIQIRLPALRKMKQESNVLKKRLDTLYRERALFRQLSTTPLFQGVDGEFLKQLANDVELISSKPREVICKKVSHLMRFTWYGRVSSV